MFSLAHGLSVCNYMYLSQTHIPPYADACDWLS